MSVLIDSSSLIGLANIGNLDLLRSVFEKISITDVVEREVTGHWPGSQSIPRAIGDWITVVESPSTGRYDIYNGLDPGEISLLEVAGSKDDVLLVIDEKVARAVARAEGFDYTGTLGVIVYGVKSGVISGSEGRKVISSLSRSDFRMTVALYDWAIKRIEDL